MISMSVLIMRIIVFPGNTYINGYWSRQLQHRSRSVHYLANSFVNGPEQNTKASGSRIRNTCRGTAGKWPNGMAHTLYRKR